jgi:tripeptidyl-peptidase-1
VSALVSLINDHRLGQGKPALGFLNPLLYKLFATQPAVFRDITVGTNRCTVDGICCPYGYDAAKGYDAVVSIRVINFVLKLYANNTL